MNEPNEVVLIPCDSSFISGYVYNDSVWVFTIQFRNGPTKAYQEVEPEVYEDFLAAESKGKWFNATMKHKYQSLVITEGVAVAPVSAETETKITRDDGIEVVGGVDTTPDDEPDPTLALATTESHGENLPPLEPPTTITDALKMLSENAGLIQATVEQNGRIAKTSVAIKVTDAATYEKAGDELKFLTEVKDRSTRFLDPIRALLLKPYQIAQQKLKEAVEPLDGAMIYLKRQRLDWSSEQERIRAEKQRQAQAEADRKAEEDRQKAGVQLTWNEIGNAIESGDEATAAALIESPIQTPGTYVPPVHIESEVPKQAGISKRKNWVAEIPGYPDELMEFEKLILDVAEGICDRSKTGSLKGHAPTNVLEPNFTALNQLAKAQEMALNYPGVRAYNKPIESVRRKK